MYSLNKIKFVIANDVLILRRRTKAPTINKYLM